MISGPWHQALGFALVGEALPLGTQQRPDVAQLIVALDEAGWPRTRISEHAHDVRGAGLPWPHPVPAELRAGMSPAQLAAALRAVRDALDLTGLTAHAPSARSALTPDERRLIAEVPPHHVPR